MLKLLLKHEVLRFLHLVFLHDLLRLELHAVVLLAIVVDKKLTVFGLLANVDMVVRKLNALTLPNKL